MLENVLESENYNILWDFPIQADKTLELNQPDITVIDNKSKKCLLIDLACPLDTRIEKKEKEKCTNCSELKYEIAKIWKMRKVEVIPVVIGALGTVTKHFEKWIERFDSDLTIEASQKPCLLGMVRIIQSVGYKMKKNKINEKKEATIPNPTGLCPLLLHFLSRNNIRPKSKDIQQGIVSSYGERDPLQPWLAIILEMVSR